MTLNEKLEIAVQLEKLGVDVIEAGFAASSQSEVDAITAISKKFGAQLFARLRAQLKAISTSQHPRFALLKKVVSILLFPPALFT